MRYLQEFKERGITKLSEIRGTAIYNHTYYCGILINISDDGGVVFYQEFYGNDYGEIKETELLHLSFDGEIEDILNISEEEFKDEYGGVTYGFYIKDVLYLIEEFIRISY